ncbi:cellulase family glycosylhydrolase [uncultured Legionella sp.]|uniref:cellulase family glycosylhydrolase n=1 Tax=uncultured Legionella sp. TaxID=210934 RepID=UPI00261BB13D|nr:cellulase family glycosylhydrolase [uncultured Legionella sp.]
MKFVKYLGLSLLLGITLDANAYYTQQGQIYDKKGNKVNINGLSWSGFQDTNVFQGLQNNPFYSVATAPNTTRTGLMDLITHPGDFADSGATKQTAVQFKTIRLPIQPGVLYDEQSEVDINKALSDKKNPSRGNGVFCKTWQSNGDACEKAVSPKQAFWIVLEEMKANKINVMIDMHHRYGYGDDKRDGTVYDMNQYATDITALANEIKQRDLDNVIGIDIFNEPYQLNWFKNKNNQAAWTKVIGTAAKAIHQANPELLLFVEGSGGGNDDADAPVICITKNTVPPSSDGYSHWTDPGNCGESREVVSFKGNWGEDFKPLLNKELAKQGIAQFDTTQFINQLNRQVADLNPNTVDWLMGEDKAGSNGHLVFSPHVYPKEVAGWETEPGSASTLRLSWSWGFLYQAGFPIVLGEASWKTSSGKDFFTQSLMPYLSESGIGTNNLYFWGIGYLGDTVSAINPDSGMLDLDVQYTLKPYFN